ncbi:MAG TPA: D-glycero-beta-D-manno-heptose 1-phosphate adenylyltransferase [bacterium]|nr:D-glycero-beta-D-manno-heptose 1-phosphate adenylyltransferase [bacterium]
MAKLKSRAALKKIIKSLKKKGKKVVFANGCFDILHVGHIRFLRSARSKGDVLVLGLNSDSSVRKIKGKGRPLVNERERAEMLSGFEFIDYILIFGEPTVDRTLLELRPDFHAKGTDYTVKTVPEREMTAKLGIKTVIAGDKKNHATTDIIRKIIQKNR